jgi:hypothetical protein
MFISTGFMVLGFVAAVLLVPSDWPSESVRNNEHQRLLDPEDCGPAPAKAGCLRSTNLASKILQLADWAAANSQLVPLVLSFFVFQLGEQAGLTLLLQYAAKRLEWTLSKVCSLSLSLLFSTRRFP